MEYIKLKEIVDIYLGLTHTPNYVEKGIPFLSVRDISGGKIDFSKCHFITQNEFDNLPNGAKPKVGDMLFCRVGTIGKPIIIDENIKEFGSFVSLGFFRSKDKNYKLEYLKYWMNSPLFFRQVQQNVKGVAQVNLNTGWLSEFKIPIKTTEEQDIIVKKLNGIQDIIQLKNNQIQELDNIIKSQFVEMFGDPITNNKKLTMLKIEGIASNEKNAIKAGPFGSSLKKDCYVKKGYKIYGQEQVIANDVNFGDYYVDESKYNELISCSVKENDILISLVGTYGKILIIPKEYKEGIINPRLMKITPNTSVMNPQFFKILFELMASATDNYTHGGTMGILNVGIIKNMRIIVPEIEEQLKYIRIVQQIDKQKFEIEASLKETETLYETLMAKYFE